MLWVFTDYHYSTLTLDYSALIADWFYRWSYFHLVSASFGKIYLCLNVIRPRVKSYGEISTVTLSPGKMRM